MRRSDARLPDHVAETGLQGWTVPPRGGTVRHMKRMMFLAFALLLGACLAQDPASIEMAPRAQPQSQGEIAFMSRLFNDIQPTSITDRREYCGLIGVDAGGSFVATEPVRGRVSSCLPPDPRFADFQVLASYHTHGAWDPDYYTEVPSFDDMRTDIEDGTDGYIATPGGRFWYVDARNQIARQVCGRGCLIADPAYRSDPDDPVSATYTLDDLRAF
ncbi:DUF4329 domain-containing protein [uncultured Tateyamaria sp.]|uniref:DUF4329 domain-containing protein n=1 Tax=Tateyamaria sp. 1078 TaxID=3417464 RepID=UPI00262046E1|nr:DUF4329 domain-containing protein [uncultured Tateyamaria sp.]